MEQQSLYCQSCSMPIDNPVLRGIEKDGTKSKDYCRFCYHEGAFTHPGLTFEEMKAHLIDRMENSDDMPEGIAESALARLPHLKRWVSGSGSTLK